VKHTASRLLIFLGILSLVISVFLVWERNTPGRLSFNLKNTSNNNIYPQSSQIPKQLIIKDLGIDLPIYPAKIDQNKWEATTNGVSYLSSSTIPGEKGNSIIYGHNWTSLLGPLTRAKPGQNIGVVFSDGSKKDFSIAYISTVTPNQTSILDPSSDTRLTIYTCTGFLDSKRFVVTAISKS